MCVSVQVRQPQYSTGVASYHIFSNELTWRGFLGADQYMHFVTSTQRGKHLWGRGLSPAEVRRLNLRVQRHLLLSERREEIAVHGVEPFPRLGESRKRLVREVRPQVDV